MMLLQCPKFSRSPSRNHTPGAICFTVPGCASVPVTKKASEARTTNVPRIQMRFFTIHSPGGSICFGGCPCYRHSNVKINSFRRFLMAVKHRRAAAVVDVAGVKVGGNHPIVVQSMTNTDTADVTGTVNQVMALARTGSELLRVTVNTEQAAAAVPRIVGALDKFGMRVPIVGDFHYNGHLLLKKYPECARALAKYRINPGNVNIGRKTDDNFRTMIEVAIENRKPVRIGVNW